MAKRKVCRSCKAFVEGDACPVCKGTSFTDNWKGRLYVSSVARSSIAQKIGIEKEGEYAIKVQ